MSKQVLVIGGSYFAGRVHAILTSRGDSGDGDIHLHVVNRGNYPLNLQNVTQYVCDRHDTEKLVQVLPEDLVFDAVVDFCAYEPNDISSVVNALGSRIKQYIFISTCSVYDPVGNSIKTEGDPMLSNFSGGVVSDYVMKKCLLEIELTNVCSSHNLPYTILRPTFIYGPFNYAPRESYFIKKIVENDPIPVPTDATGRFSFVYVMDVADIINLSIANPKAYNEIFNLSGNDETYETFLKMLEICNGGAFATTPVTVKQVIDENIPLPFPLNNDELYSGKKVEDVFGYKYTSFETGMKKTFSVFKNVYAK